MPAEWESHKATWIAWPWLEADWPGKLEAVEWCYTEIVRVLGSSELVEIICKSEAIIKRAYTCLKKSSVNRESYRLHCQDNDRTWLRDSAPTAVFSNESLEWIAWKFNAWAKYENFLKDQEIPNAVSQISEIPLTSAIRPDNGNPLVLEGGAIETDGQGTLLVTEECLLSEVQQRNPGLTKSGYEEAFGEYLGVQKTIWLGRGCEGDDTHGHIDDIARFVAPGKVVAAVPESETDPNYEALKENFERLQSATDAMDRRLQVIQLPVPRRIVYDTEALPASYANFYIANTVVLVPTFNDPADVKALGILSELFPDREVVGIHAVDLVVGQGTLHCLTQQQPAVKSSP